MAKDADKLTKIFEVLTSYRPVLARHVPIPTPPPWANEAGVERPAPTLTGPPPPWPIGITITLDMQRDRDWLVQHPDLRDTDEYRTMYDRLAEQLGLSPDTLEPLRSSPPAPRSSLPTEQTAEPPPRVESDASETAPQRKHAGGAPPRLTDDEVMQLQAAYQAVEPAVRRRERKQLDVFEDLRRLLPESKRSISDPTLRRIIVRPLHRP